MLGASQLLALLAKKKPGSHVHLINAYSVALASKDKDLLEVFLESDANFCDGRPISWISKIYGDYVNHVRGPSLFRHGLQKLSDAGVRVFFLGSTPDTLNKLVYEVTSAYPQLQIAGSFSPPFREFSAGDELEIDQRVRGSGAEVVWVGLGTPKQDYEAARLAKSCGVTSIAIGAAFDFLAGSKREAPRFVSLIGLEWLFRFASEPRRLWKRYLLGNLVFLSVVFSGLKRSSR
jgi:N-acetylglucosaminyldiphosphoundecaprenol N-acetyl-beta-D-mannosaminyltransferase